MLDLLLNFHVLMAVYGTCNGAIFPANSYTLTGVVSVNGSDDDGRCPRECVGEASGIRRCDCMGTEREGTITGVLIDGMIPTIDTSQRGNWTSQLFTIQGSVSSYALGFRFQSHVVALQEVELYVLYCPAWQIGAMTVNVYDSESYPSFIRTAPSVGSVNLTSNMQNCESLTRVSIPLKTTLRISSYFIEFTNPTQVHWLHIAEVRFSDQPISTVTTDGPTDPITEPSSDAVSETLSEQMPAITASVVTTTSIITPQNISMITPGEAATAFQPTTTTTVNPTDSIIEPSLGTVSSSLSTSTPTSDPSTKTSPSEQTLTMDTQFSTYTLINTGLITITISTPQNTPVATTGATFPPSIPTTSVIDSHSFLTAIIVLVGVVVVLLIIVPTGVAVIIGCFIKIFNHTQSQHLQDKVLRDSSTEGNKVCNRLELPELITQNNYHYQTSIELRSRNPSSPVLPLPDRMSPTIKEYDMYLQDNRLSIMKSRDIIYHDIKTIQNEETSDILYDDILSNETEDDKYSTVAEVTKQKESAQIKPQKDEYTSSSSSTRKVSGCAYSLIQKKDAPAVPVESLELYRDLNTEGDKEKHFTKGKQKSVDTEVDTINTCAKGKEECDYYDIMPENKKLISSAVMSTSTLSIESYCKMIKKEKLNLEVNENTITSGPMVFSTPVYLDKTLNSQSFHEVQMRSSQDHSFGREESSSVEGHHIKVNNDVLNKVLVTNSEEDKEFIYSNPDDIIDEEEDIYDLVYSKIDETQTQENDGGEEAIVGGASEDTNT